MNPRPTHLTFGALALVTALATGCGGGPTRAEVLTTVATEQIVPAYERFEAAATDLDEAAEALCSGQGDLATAQAALGETRAAWSFSEPMWVGPVMERRSWALIDWPIAADEIEELVADNGIALDTELLAKGIGADQRGLGAVEYLLDTDMAEGGRRCAYLTGLTEVIATEAAEITTSWTTSYEDDPGFGARVGDDEEEVLDMIVNDSLYLLEAITDAELANVLGLDGEVDPDAIDEGSLGLGVADVAEHVAGLRSVLVGPDGASGLAPLLGDDLADRLETQFDAADAAIAAVDGSLREAAADDADDLAAARDAIKAIQVTVAADVVSQLGVTVGFSDADGDSG